MSEVGAPRHAAIPTADPVVPLFARLPDPSPLFAQRSQRLLVRDHQLAPFLGLRAGVDHFLLGY
jgi:FdhE protein